MGKGSGKGSGSGYHLRGGHATTVLSAPPMEARVGLPQHQLHSQSEDRPCYPKGLKNVGNTCYANAALQCLLSTAIPQALLDPKASAIFRRYSSNQRLLESVADEGQRLEETMHEKCNWLTQELKSMTLEYTTLDHSMPDTESWVDSWFQSAPDRAVVDPGSITSQPDRLSKCLHPYQQEDAHEFLRALLGTLCMNGQNKELSSLFDGLLESAVVCQTCRRPSLTRDRYMDLSLDIVGPQVRTLVDALREFTKCETLTGENKVHCQHCQVRHTATKGLRLATAPSILVCHLKRFGFDNYGNLQRIGKKVQFPLTLEISEYMSRVNKARPPPYELVAVLVHEGRTCESGHYVAYVKNNGCWFKCNDSIVTQVNVETVLAQQAYILMYEVAEMRERHGYPSPNKSVLKSRSQQRPQRRNSNSLWWTGMFCGLDDTLIRDMCCVEEGLCSGWSSSTGRRRTKESHDDSTVGSDNSGRFMIRRSVSSDNLKDSRRSKKQAYNSRSSPPKRVPLTRESTTPASPSSTDAAAYETAQTKRWSQRELPPRHSSQRRVLSSDNLVGYATPY